MKVVEITAIATAMKQRALQGEARETAAREFNEAAFEAEAGWPEWNSPSLSHYFSDFGPTVIIKRK